MSNIKHTPEPWTWGAAGHIVEITATNGKGLPTETIISLQDVDDDNRRLITMANAARIVACVNAMAGIEEPAEFMKQVDESFNATMELKAQRDELLKALEGIINYTTVEFAERWGFGPQRLKVSEVYDRVKWGTANVSDSSSPKPHN